MARYIDANKADVERISCFYGGECRLEDVQEWLDEQPTANVIEVVRCKECEHYNKENCFCSLHSFYMEENDFCSKSKQ